MNDRSVSWKSWTAGVLGEVASNALSHLATTLIDRALSSEADDDEDEEDLDENDSEGA